MTTFSDLDIIQGLVEGQIICRPLRLENVRGASIDLTLGENFWRCDADPTGVFNPYDSDEIARYFAGPFAAKPYEAVYEKLQGRSPKQMWPLPAGHPACPRNDWSRSKSPFKGIPDDWPVIVLRPGERILAHTHEFVGIKPPRMINDGHGGWRKLKGGTSQLHARSSSGRIGIKVCDDAGLGDPGYFDRWTMEMRNDNKEAIVIPVGERIAQINFHETGMTREAYGTEKLYESKYQTTDDVERMVSEWRPENMLPRNYKDSRVELGDLSTESYEDAIGSIILDRKRAERQRVELANRAGSASVLD